MNADILDNIYEESNIQFILISEGKIIYKSKGYLDLDTNICSKFAIGANKYEIKVCKEDKRALALLVHCIKKALLEINYRKDKIILDILEGKNVLKDDVIRSYPFMNSRCSIIVIYTDDNLEKVFELIEEGYKDINTVHVVFEDKIVILGNLENAKEHAESIRESLAYDFCTRCIVCYANYEHYMELSKVYRMCDSKIKIALKLNINQDVIGQKDLLFEEAVDSISDQNKTKLIEEFDSGFNKIDNQMFKTIDTFFECGLNLSEAAKELYIHRNTLIYRLDKILKETGFDLRNFNDAVVFKMISLIWKEFKN